MSRVGLLFQTRYVTLSIVDHPPGLVHAASEDVICFVETGAFTLRPFRLDIDIASPFTPGMLIVAPRGTEFACEHDVAMPKGRCLSVSYSAETIDALRTAGLPLLRPLGILASPRQRFLRRRLRSLRTSSADEDTTLHLDLIAAALFESIACPRAMRNMTAPVSQRLMRRIARAAELIESEYARPLKLTDLAAAAEMSPYHFARSFGDLVGVPPHRYLSAIRLREAVRLILDGESVTTACYAVGFSSPSHFTVTFKQRFGIVPSALTRTPNPALIRALNIGPWGRRMGRLPYANLGFIGDCRDAS